MSEYCKHLVPLYHSCQNCHDDKDESTKKSQLEIQISQLENQLQACRALVKAQEKKIVELATKLAYANRSIEILNEEKEEEPQYLYVYRNKNSNSTLMSAGFFELTDWGYLGKVRVEK